MAKYDVEIIKGSGGAVVLLDVQDRTSSSDVLIQPGEPVKQSGNYVVHVGNGEPVITAPMLGVSQKLSTETATADGKVPVQLVVPGKTILRCKVTTAGNIDTAAKLLLLMMDSITFDRTGTDPFTFRINEDEGSDPNVHGLFVVGGSITEGTMDVLLKDYATAQGESI